MKTAAESTQVGSIVNTGWATGPSEIIVAHAIQSGESTRLLRITPFAAQRGKVINNANVLAMGG